MEMSREMSLMKTSKTDDQFVKSSFTK